MMLSLAGTSMPLVAPSRRISSCAVARFTPQPICSISSKPRLLTKAAASNCKDGSSKDDAPAASVIATSVLAASLVCVSSVLPPAASAGPAPSAYVATAGAEETKKLIESSGTPGAARPDTMKTNVPFQAPGINAPPRGPAQEQGTTLKRSLKNAGKQIKENTKDPDSTPFGISKGPLVREGKKAGQPGKLSRFGQRPSEEYQKQSSSTTAANEIATGRPVARGYYNVFDKFSRKQAKQ